MGLEAALVIGALVAAGSATAQNVAANKARGQARAQQAEQLTAAREAANKAKGAVVDNSGTVALDSEEALADDAIKSRANKNRLRVDRTGLSLGGSAGAKSASATGLRI